MTARIGQAVCAPLSPIILFDLALETRRRIYRICLNRRIAHKRILYHAITLVCKQTRSETLPILLEETLSFGSLASFVRWTTIGSPSLLDHVRDISLRIQQDLLSISPETVPECTASTVRKILTLDKVFLSIPQLRSLWLNIDSSHTSEHDADEYQRKEEEVLSVIANSCPSLTSLTLFGNPVNLDHLTGLRDLRILRWTLDGLFAV